MKGKHFELVVGIVIGAVLFGGGTAYAAGLLAEPSTQTFYLGNQQIQLEAYAINGNNYVKIRDVGQVVDFNVAYDPVRNAAIIEPDKPYTGEDVEATRPVLIQESSEGVDYAAQANPAVFTEELTRDVYNAIRDTIVGHEAILAGNRVSLSVEDTAGRQEVINMITAALGVYPAYESIIPEYGRLACNAKIPSAYTEAVKHTQDFIDSLSELAQDEQVKQIAWYVCDRLTYTTKIALPSKVLASDEVTAGNCMTYARSFQFLCDRAGIPCLLVHSETHQWNKVYVNGKWWDVDVTSNDVGDETYHREYATILCAPSDMQGKNYINEAPEVTAFTMELLIPGSTQ